MTKKLFIALLVLLPAATFAVGDIDGLVHTLIKIANSLYKLIFVLVVLAFAWGVLKFVFQSGDAQEKGKSMMLWSIVALFVLVSVWGIVVILQKTLGIEGQQTITPPAIPVPVATE